MEGFFSKTSFPQNPDQSHGQSFYWNLLSSFPQNLGHSQGRTIFWNLISSFPKNLDLSQFSWSVLFLKPPFLFSSKSGSEGRNIFWNLIPSFPKNLDLSQGMNNFWNLLSFFPKNLDHCQERTFSISLCHCPHCLIRKVRLACLKIRIIL